MKASATVKPGDWGRGIVILALSFTLATALAACGGKPPRIQPPVDEIVDAQITNLRSDDFTVRRCAAVYLGRLGPQAKKALPALNCARWDVESTVRDAVEVALALIDPDAAERPLVRLALSEARR